MDLDILTRDIEGRDEFWDGKLPAPVPSKKADHSYYLLRSVHQSLTPCWMSLNPPNSQI
jgi:hypothetical protein